MPSSTRGLRRFALALCALTMLASAAHAKTDACRAGASALSDAKAIAGVRGAIARACPCADFDASTPEKTHSRFVKCAKAVITDATDGPPLLGAFTLRKQCKGEVKKIYAHIIRVDQGSPGNNAVAKVPDLASLSALPRATAEGGLGEFLDDDGLVASIAPFVATSLGGPGPVVNGVMTWLDITEAASFPPCPGAGCLTPDNGPAPTTLASPSPKWGQEKEVTRMDRMAKNFYLGGTNFTDVYYPAAGPSVTAVTGVCTAGVCSVGNVGASCSTDGQCSQSINLDSTALSVGRGRRDIENLTQAANINIPVIAFGGTNGLATVPGVYSAFGVSIGVCTASSCDGTPRVVDRFNPNPAFPTFGGVGGGFEVVMAEGFAHLDVVTAEDDADDPIPAALLAFLQRNIQ
jgi:hypothetical protein